MGVPESMMERVATIADTTNTGNMLRNFDKYKKQLFPINKLQLQNTYELGKRILNNPSKGQSVNETSTLKSGYDGRTGLGAFQNFGVV